MKKKIFTIIILLLIPSIINAESIKLDSSWRFAEFSKINSGSATLYKASNGNGHTVTVNAGHGTKGGENVKTPSHPDGTAKVTGGTTAAGAKESTAVSSGMEFSDGTPEATVTLQLAKKIKEKLLANGYNVVMIRESSDVQLDNIARTVIANNTSDIHIAIHFDSTSSDKGAFYMSVPELLKYQENVNKTWRQSEALGDSIISAFREDNLKVFSQGYMDMDLTQTAYTEIPSIDFEYGDKISDKSDSALEKYAEATVKGIANYFNEDYTPTKSGDSNSDNKSSGNNDSSSYSLDTSNLSENDQQIIAQVVKEWPSELESDRIDFIQRSISLMNMGITYCLEGSKKDGHCPRNAATKANPETGDTLDCSDYVSNVFLGIGKTDVGDNTVSGFNDSPLFTKVSESEVLPGDLAIRLGTEFNHILIYLGTANGNKVYANSSRPEGPQIGINKTLSHYIRYKNWNGEKVTSNDVKTKAQGEEVGIGKIVIDWELFTEEHITCESILTYDDGDLNPLGEALSNFYILMKVAAPVLTIVLSTLEYIKAIASSNADDLKKTNKRTIKRMAIGLVVFFLPDLLDLLFKLFGLYGISICI